MLEIVMSHRFKKDLKLSIKRGYNMALLEKVVNCLAARETLEAKYKDHSLTGNHAGFRECHITPDWILIYRIENNELYLLLSRTGTHSDLF